MGYPHRNLRLQAVHVPHAFEYANATARTGATGFATSDLFKLALQLDDYTVWMLTAISPVSWKQVGQTPQPTFPAGTRMLFQQSTAPTGWTKDTTVNDKALRVVSGAVGSGGSVAFSTLFGRTIVDSTTLVASQMPSHAHSTYINSSLMSATIQGLHVTNDNMDTTLIRLSGALSVQTTSQGGNGSHTHGLDLRLAYVDIIIATKA
ncbi:hypothetical protein [Nitratidesulfovibrio vulgaris]|uniref:hypothetical protein n=1 Tax=Nitratidesulfovibrio vulgaris TaxID=881 RepID=UPI0013DF62E7|nr:hypothetical protein [Nitratidesulfovibrio vulgaris]